MPFLRLFGHPMLESDGNRSAIKVPAKAVALLAVAVANHLRPLSREWLAEALWPDADPAEARANLRRHLHLCLKAIGEDALTLTRTTVQWNAESATDVDVIRFETISQTQPGLAVQEYAGELCAGVGDEALETLRVRYRSAYETLLRRLIESARAAKDDSQLAIWLQRALNEDPFDETAVRQIMELRARNGDRTGALREFNAFAQRLHSELRAEPERETIEIFERITGTADRPRVPNNLPNASTTFVGRAKELSQLCDALRASRIVTLAGPGGIGKSRLAIRAAHTMLPAYDGGAWFIGLEHAKGERAIWQRIAEALSLPAANTPRDVVLQALERRDSLIILDTCEHAAEPARAVAECLAGRTSTTVLATSRRKLQAIGEYVLDVPPLEIPSDDAAGAQHMQFAAYRLFVERATAVSPAFQVLPADTRALLNVLRRTDGLPLAIELIASRANVLTIEGMRKRLQSVMRATHRNPATAHAQTIDDTIGWSYGLLTAEQQQVFRAASVFQASFGIEDIEQICTETADVAMALFELVDASLIAVNANGSNITYHLLDTTRDFARRGLLEAGGRAAFMRHAELFAQKAQELASAPEVQLGVLLPRTLAIMPDYLAALEYAREHQRFDIALQILEGIYRFGVRKYAAAEMLQCVESLLACGQAADITQRARLTRIAATLAPDDTDRAYALGLRAIELYREIGDEVALCEAMSGHAATLFYMGRHEESERLLIEAYEGAQRAGATRVYLKTAGRLAALMTDYEATVTFLAPAIDQMLEIGELRQAAWAYRNLAVGAFYSKRWMQAADWAAKAEECYATGSEPLSQALVLTMRGCALHEAGHRAQALRTHLQGLTLCSPFEQYVEAVECLEDISTTLAKSGALAAAARITGFAMHARSRMGAPVTEQQLGYYAPVRQELSQALGPVYELERAAGAQMSWSQACEIAGEELARLLVVAEENEDTTSLS